MLWEECSELLLLVIDPLHPTLHYVYMECFELLLVEMLTLHYVDRKCFELLLVEMLTLHYVDRECFELLLVEMLVSLSYFCRPAGLTNIKPDEEAAWKMWQSSGGLIQPSFVNPHRGAAGAGGAGDASLVPGQIASCVGGS
ncbi:unnamed protein product [Closterium sp. NIES-64]|nr:unnamed protein product [Closterium sp. NIES-64]